MPTTVPAAEFKRRLSEYLGRVRFKRESILITRRGKPVAQLGPADELPVHLSRTQGWLDDADPFFAIMGSIVADRAKHSPRAAKRR